MLYVPSWPVSEATPTSEPFCRTTMEVWSMAVPRESVTLPRISAALQERAAHTSPKTNNPVFCLMFAVNDCCESQKLPAHLFPLRRESKPSMLHLPAPVVIKNRNIKQNRTAGSPPFWSGQKPASRGAWDIQ